MISERAGADDAPRRAVADPRTTSAQRVRASGAPTRGKGFMQPSDELLLAAFLDSVPYRVYFKDIEGRVIKASTLQATRFGLPDAQHLVGATDFELLAPEHAEVAFHTEQLIIASGEPRLRYEELEVFPDGRHAWVETSKVALRDATGQVIGTIGISHDITARKRAKELLAASEARQRKLLAALQEIVILLDPTGRITYASPAVARWLGYSPHELIGWSLADLSHPEDLTDLQCAFDSSRPAASAFLPHRVRASDGSWRSLDSTFVQLDHDSSDAVVLIASRDVTERLALEREREQLETERRVSQRLEAVGQLAAGIAHEINTPLQFVGDSVTFLNTAVDQLLLLIERYREAVFIDQAIPQADRRESIERAEENADVEYLLERIPVAFKRTVDGIERVRSIVQAMKRFSHTGPGEAAPADLNEAIETTLTVCRSEYKYVADVSFCPGALPPVTCNIAEINQVFLNLIVNAAQAIDEQKRTEDRGRIEIETWEDGTYATVRISDDGPGIPRELQDRIYDPFFTTKAVGKGTGQGLAIALAAVQRHGATLECVSAPGQGTTFTLRIPLDQPTASAAQDELGADSGAPEDLSGEAKR